MAYEKALRVYTLEGYPVDYAMIQNNLGAAYRSLADVMDRKGNLAKAIKAYDEALKIYTAAKYPSLPQAGDSKFGADQANDEMMSLSQLNLSSPLSNRGEGWGEGNLLIAFYSLLYPFGVSSGVDHA